MIRYPLHQIFPEEDPPPADLVGWESLVDELIKSLMTDSQELLRLCKSQENAL